MGLLKVLGWAAAGVGCVAAAPFVGAGSVLAAGVGLAGSLAGAAATGSAVAAGVGGAIVGAALSDDEEEDKNNAKREGIKAGELKATQKYHKKIHALSKRIEESNEADRKIVGLFAVAVSVANVDGKISNEERAEMDMLISGLSSNYLSPNLTAQIKRMRKTPPSIEDAIKKAKEYGVNAEDIDTIIDVMINADGRISPAEKRFVTQWETDLKGKMFFAA